MSKQPVITAINGREFACTPVGLVIFLMNQEEKILFLSSPSKRKLENTWEVPSGALEAGETILAGVIRETHEELGEEVRFRPLGTIHSYTFRYDENVSYMISLCYLMAYEGGKIISGDDMQGSSHKWASIEEIKEQKTRILPPAKRVWVVERAIELYRLWKNQEIDLQQLD